SVTVWRALVESLTKEKVAPSDFSSPEEADDLSSSLPGIWRAREGELNDDLRIQAPDKRPNLAPNAPATIHPLMEDPSVLRVPADETQRSEEHEKSSSVWFWLAFFTGSLMHSPSAAAPGRVRRNPIVARDDHQDN